MFGRNQMDIFSQWGFDETVMSVDVKLLDLVVVYLFLCPWKGFNFESKQENPRNCEKTRRYAAGARPRAAGQWRPRATPIGRRPPPKRNEKTRHAENNGTHLHEALSLIVDAATTPRTLFDIGVGSATGLDVLAIVVRSVTSRVCLCAIVNTNHTCVVLLFPLQ